MKRFVIEEVKQITIKTEVVAEDAREAMSIYKGTNHSKKQAHASTVTEEIHISIELKKEEKE